MLAADGNATGQGAGHHDASAVNSGRYGQMQVSGGAIASGSNAQSHHLAGHNRNHQSSSYAGRISGQGVGGANNAGAQQLTALTGRYQNNNGAGSSGLPVTSSHRIRESSSGALVGKNIAGIGGIGGVIGKSSTNILKDDKINLAKINMINNDPRKKFGTHHHDSSKNQNSNSASAYAQHQQTTSSSHHATSASGGKAQTHNSMSQAARNNLHIHRITSQQDTNKAHFVIASIRAMADNGDQPRDGINRALTGKDRAHPLLPKMPPIHSHIGH